MKRVSLFFTCVCAALTSVASPTFAAPARGDLFTVANVAVEASASDAVQAKKIAIETAQRRAFHSLLLRLTDFRLHDRLPPVQHEQIERLVTNIDVRNEGVSNTSYQASFDVGFSSPGVKQLLNEFALPYSLDRAPGMLIVPVYIEAGAAIASDRNPWRSALKRRDLQNGPVPITLAPTRSDLTADIVSAYFASPASAIQSLQNQHRTRNVMLAVAEPGAGGDTLTLRLAGADALGEFTLERKLRVKDAESDELADFGAKIAYETLQQRWKLTRPVSELAAAGRGGSLTPVELTAEFSGLREWQAIRGKLQKLPGLQGFEVKSVNPRGAQISLEFPGGADQLAQVAGSGGLAVENSGRGWVVRTR
jgi:hypothetical protein